MSGKDLRLAIYGEAIICELRMEIPRYCLFFFTLSQNLAGMFKPEPACMIISEYREGYPLPKDSHGANSSMFLQNYCTNTSKFWPYPSHPTGEATVQVFAHPNLPLLFSSLGFVISVSYCSSCTACNEPGQDTSHDSAYTPNPILP